MILKKIGVKIAGDMLVEVIAFGDMLNGWREIANIHVKLAEGLSVIKVITSWVIPISQDWDGQLVANWISNFIILPIKKIGV